MPNYGYKSIHKFKNVTEWALCIYVCPENRKRELTLTDFLLLPDTEITN